MKLTDFKLSVKIKLDIAFLGKNSMVVWNYVGYHFNQSNQPEIIQKSFEDWNNIDFSSEEQYLKLMYNLPAYIFQYISNRIK